MAVVSRITIYPVKSCDGIDCTEVDILSTGAIRFDRRFALVDSSGKFINAKRFARIHQLQLQVDPVRREYRACRRGESTPVSGRMDYDGKQLSDWLSDFFAQDVSIIENEEHGFPDDLDSPGPTIVSLATLQVVASWFPELTVDDIRRRFRANIEVDGVEAFWEDRLYREDKQPASFTIGRVLFAGINPCQRCAVPTRDALSGDVTPSGFAQLFSRMREQTLPAWAARNRFDHFYRLTTNTRRLDQGAAQIQVGDPVEIMNHQL